MQEWGDLYSSFLNLASLGAMLEDIAQAVDIPHQSVLEGFRPNDLSRNAALFDAVLNDYLNAYGQAGITPVRYPDTAAFRRHYLQAP